MAGALNGMRVIDFGQYLAGPLLAVLLADNGADVIRIEPPGGPRWKHAANAVLQRGKRSIVLGRLHRASDRWFYLVAPSFADLSNVEGLQGATRPLGPLAIQARRSRCA